MLPQLLKWGVLLGIWRRYGGAIKLLPLLLLVLAIIFYVHGDYINYVEVSENQHWLARSFLIKWLLVLAVVGIYWLYVKRLLATPSGGKSKKPEESLQSERKTDAEPDPYKNIREKDTLRSRSDVLIQNRKR